jgi:(hydroxyamino)benzene mutase
MGTSNTITATVDRSLVRHAALMTLLGLLSGFTPFFAKAPTMALTAHRIGVIQGALLFGLAAVWPSLEGSPGILKVARYCGLAGLWANWLGVQLAAFWSAKQMMIVTGGAIPDGAAPWMEAVVAVLLNASALVLVTCLLILWTQRGGGEQDRATG